MMIIYKLTICPLTSFRTPLQSDTIFGHLLWALRYREGEEALTKFLARYHAGDPPLLVSEGFPAGTLPVPVLTPAQKKSESIANDVMEDMVRKAREEDCYLPLDQWRKIAEGLSAEALDCARREAREELRRLRQASEPLRRLQEAEREHPVTRTAVDRITGSAREGRLFVAQETFYTPGRTIEIWHKLADEDTTLLARLNVWWRWVERNGFGRRKSAGHGAFRIEGEGLVEEAGALPHVENPNGFVTLSAWVPRQNDPTDVTYRTRIKRGKLAEALAIPSAWKKPLLMLEPGAVACLPDGEEVHEWYGRLVEDMHWPAENVPEWQKQALIRIVQYGYAFPLGVRVSV